jgi:hypothetical protein
LTSEKSGTEDGYIWITSKEVVGVFFSLKYLFVTIRKDMEELLKMANMGQ